MIINDNILLNVLKFTVLGIFSGAIIISIMSIVYLLIIISINKIKDCLESKGDK